MYICNFFPAVQLSNDIIQPASFTFAGLIACQQRLLLLRLEKDFEHRVTKRVNELCEEGISCAIQDLETTCEHSEGQYYKKPKYSHNISTPLFLPASVAQLDAPSNWRPGGCGFNPRRGRQHSFVEIDREIFSVVILSLPLIQEGQLSVSGERMCTILVNRLED